MHVDVAIAGAGPAGLSAAAALRKADPSLKVRTSALSLSQSCSRMGVHTAGKPQGGCGHPARRCGEQTSHPTHEPQTSFHALLPGSCL